MAVSPTITRPANASPSLTLTAAKAKAHAVLQNGSSDATTSDPPQSLSARLNDETRRKYVRGKQLGEGTYAIVYSGHHASDPAKLVAIKKIKPNKDYTDGLTMDAVREIKFLQELHGHANIIRLEAVFASRNRNLNLVLEYLPLGDLEMLIKDTSGVHYGPADIKAWMGMLCRAVWFCHENFVLHRDIKPNNLLIAADGEVKLADFGLARSFADPYGPMTHQVITRWYRPPELFYQARFYSGAVDIWSAGLVFAELVVRTPYLPGDTDIHQLELICKALGTPTEDNWPGVSQLEAYVPYEKAGIVPVPSRQSFAATFGPAGTQGVDLLMRMLKLNPRSRVTARQALEHPWWNAEPKPSAKEDLPRKSAAAGEKKMGEDLKRRGGELEHGGRADKVARKLDFGSSKKG